MSAPGTGGDVTATGRLIFDASSVRAGVNQAHSSLTSLYEVVRDNWWGIKAIGEAFAGVGAAVAGGLGEAVSAAANFESEMAAVARTTYDSKLSADQNAAAAAELGKQLQALAETRPVDLKTLTSIAEQAGALGIASKDVATFTGTIADLITTTNLTTQSATSLARVANLFNITGDQYKNLSSAIYTAGVSTAATETEIVNFTTRLAPFGAQAGLTASQTIGLAASIASLGPRAEAGSTAIQKLFQQIAEAATGEAPAKLAAFAKVAGVTTDEFQNLAKTDIASVLTKIIDGLASTSTNAVTAQQSLSSLGIINSREITTLEALARGTKAGADSNTDLANNINKATDAYNRGTDAQNAAAKQNQTLNAQLQESKNILGNIAISFGNQLITPIKDANGAFRTLAIGIEDLPAPIKEAVTGSAALVGSFAAVAAVLLLIGPRVLLAIGAYQRLAAGYAVAMAAQRAKIAADGEETASAFAVGFQSVRNAAAFEAEAAAKARSAAITEANLGVAEAQLALNIQQNELAALTVELDAAQAEGNTAVATTLELKIAAMEANIAATEQQIVITTGEVAALSEETAAMGAAAIASGILGSALAFLTGPFGIALLAIGAVIGATYLFGKSQQDSADTTQQAATASAAYAQALKDEAAGQKGAVAVAIAHDLAVKGLITSAQAYGITTKELVDYITGISTNLDRNNTLLDSALSTGDKAALGFKSSIDNLKGSYDATVNSANDAATATQDLGSAVDGADGGVQDLAADTRTLAQIQDQAAQAALGMAGDILSVEGATLSLTKSQQSYASSNASSGKSALDLAKDELAVKSAQLSRVEAVNSLKAAETDLANARSNQRKQLSSDQSQLTSDQNAYQDALQKVRDAQSALAKLQTEDRTLAIKEATDKLKQSRLDLVSATTKANDAQYYLNYLQSEGASARDIADAQNALAQSQLDVSKATTGISDAQASLNDLDAAHYAADLAKAQRDVRDALNAVSDALKKVHEDQAKVKQDQKDIANDTAYKEALLKVQEQQINLQQATLAISDAQERLTSTTNTGAGAQLSMAEATHNVVQSALALASAQTQQYVDQRTANGETTTAQQKLDFMRAALIRVAGTVQYQFRPAILSLADDLKTKIPSQKTVNLGLNAGPAEKSANDFIAFFNQFIKELDGTIITPRVNIAPGAGVPGLPSLGHAQGAIISSKTYLNGGQDFMGEAGSEAIMPLTELYNLLRPIGEIAKSIEASNAMLNYHFAVQPSNQTEASKTEINHNYDFKIEANSPVDVDNIGADIVWAMGNAGF